MPRTVKLLDGITNPGICICESKGMVLICQERATYFPFCNNFPPLKMLFQKDLKQEPSELVTGILPVVSDTTEGGRICNRPIGIVFSKDASTPSGTQAILVVCEEISMS